MKNLRLNFFAPDSRSSVILLAIAGFSTIPGFAVDTTGVTNTYNGSLAGNGIGTNANWTEGAPFNSTGLGAYSDLVFTGAASGSTFTGSGGSVNMNAESINVVDGNSYALQINSTTYSRYNIGATSNTGSGEVTLPFTNSVSGVAQDLIYLTGGSDLTFNATNTGTGAAGEMRLRQAGNFNIGTDSILTMDALISATSGSSSLTINGDGTTIFNGANTYTGATNIRGGTLEIVGTNTGSSYTINGLENPSEPVLKLSNLDALPSSAILKGSNSVSLDGFVDLAVAGDYFFDVYDGGHIKFTASSGSPTSLYFTGVSKISSGANSGRTLSNLSENLSIVFDSTLDIGGDGDANVAISSTGSTTVTGGILSTGDGVRSFTKSGSGSVVLSAASEYAGTTTISAGVLRLDDALALPGGIDATGGTSSLIFTGTTGVIGLTAESGNFLRTVGPGADQVTANPTATSGEGESMGFAAYGGDRVVDVGASILLSSLSYAGDGLTLGANDSDSKVTVVNSINLASSRRNVVVYDGSADVDAEISGVISSTAGTLVKRGDGTLSLTGVNTYGGGTEVLAGTLAVDGDSLDDSGGLIIDGGKVDLTGAETVNTLFFGVAQQAAGTYSSDGAGDTIASANFTGSGTLIVVSGGGDDPFKTWAETENSLMGDDALPGGDPDKDGLSNTLEFVLGGDPNANDSPSVRPSVTDGITAITLTFNRSDESELQPVTVKVQVSADLVTWNPADDITIGAMDGSGPNGVTYTVAENADAPDTVVVTIPKDNVSKKFARVDAVIP